MALYSKELIEKRGWGWWAVEVPGVADFIGFIGLNQLLNKAFSPELQESVEIGWRLAHPFWNKGYATEGARAALKYGFETLQLPRIVSITAVSNIRSQHVMKKIGLHHDPANDFEHPVITPGHPLRPHVLYHLNLSDWHNRDAKT